MLDASTADEARFVPSASTRGPWDPAAQHGGPPAALCARAVERHPGGEAMRLTRLTVELLRPVPLTPLVVTTELVRPGRNVQLVAVRVTADGRDVVAATGMRQRHARLPLDGAIGQAPAAEGPEAGAASATWDRHGVRPAFHLDAAELRFVRGGFDRQGPALAWIRLLAPLVEGEVTSGACRAAACADFGNGVSSVLAPDGGLTYVNPDLTVSLHRHPVGEWVGLDAETTIHPDGVGMARSVLHDTTGPVGHAVQLLVVAAS